jgi:phenylacetate-CoA ligase
MLRYFNSFILYPLLERFQKRKILSKVEQIKLFDEQNFRTRKKLNKQRLYELLVYANINVPYYRDLFKQVGFSPEKFLEDESHFNIIPLLTKNEVQRQGSRMLSQEYYQKEHMHERKTGGSTGTSTLIYYSNEALDYTAASNLFALEFTGKKRYLKEIHLSSKFPEEFPLKDIIKEKIKCIALNRINIETASFDENEMKNIFLKIKSANAYYLEAHPSTIYALAIYVKQNNINLNKPLFDVFESTGEVLQVKQRNEIEKYLKCKVYDRYGNAEFGIIAHEKDNSDNALKVIDFMVYPEPWLEENGCELVLTTLTNKAMPLIRYKTGDLIGKLDEKEDGYYISNIEGRIHDLIYIDGKAYPTHYIQDLLDRIGNIIEFQVENLDNGKLKIYLVVPNENFHENIKNRISSWWKDKVLVEFIELDQLKRVGWRDKFRYVIDSREQK